MIALGRRRVALVAVLGLALLSGCSAPPPVEVVCEDCVDGVSAVTEETNRSVAVSESTTHLYLRESGGARVEAEVTLDGAGVDEFRANGTLLDLVRAKLTEGAPTRDEDRDERPAFDRRDLRVAMDGEDLVVTYRVAEMDARRIGGTVLFDRFYRQKGEGRLEASDPDDPARIETDRLVVHGPDGTEPLAEPPGATMHGDRLVWESDRISTRTYLLFGAPGTPDAVATVATTVDVLTWASRSRLWGRPPPGLRSSSYSRAVSGTPGESTRRTTGRRCRTGDSRCSSSSRSGPWSRGPRSFPRVRSPESRPSRCAGRRCRLRLVGVVHVLRGRDRGVDRRRSGPGGRSSRGRRRDRRVPEDVLRGHGDDGKAGPPRRLRDAASPSPHSRRRGDGRGRDAVDACPGRGPSRVVRRDGGLPLGLVPLVAFAALGFGVVDRDRTRLRWVAVGASLVSAWVVAFGRAVAVGAHGSGGAWMVLFWGLAASYVGALLFYVALWTATR
ncbi:hypothetical protein ACFQL4_10900 [Halosimplex aquaticum]